MRSQNKRLNSYQLAKLHTFETAARHCSFALAAAELSLTPSAVSHRINHLEQELGFKLFIRYHRKIELTAEGARVFWAIKSSLTHLNQEILEIKNQELSGNLTVYCRPSIAQCWLVPRLADFCQHYPVINLTILTGNDNINFHRHGVDLAIYFDNSPPKKLTCYSLMQEWIIPVCSPLYAQQHQLINNPANLAQATLLHDRQAWSFDSDSDEWQTWARQMAITLPQGQHEIGFDRSDLAVLAAINHAGLAMGRKNLVAQRIKNGELITPFRDTAVLCEQYYYIVTLPEQQNPKIAAFLQWLHNQVEKDERLPCFTNSRLADTMRASS